jgi:hypothetical protein
MKQNELVIPRKMGRDLPNKEQDLFNIGHCRT